MSVITSAMIAASMDLPINPSLGFAHIVPYGGVAQFQIGWKGVIQLALRSGKYETINLAKIKEGQIRSRNSFTGDIDFQEDSTSEKVVGYLLYFKLVNGYRKFFYMTAEECEAHGKRYSATYKKGFGRWQEDFEAMALKTVAKLGLSKYGLLSVEMQKAVEYDQATVPSLEPGTPPVFLDGNDEKIPEGEVVPPKETSSRLAAAIENSPI
jgi:recombination protein RecT